MTDKTLLEEFVLVVGDRFLAHLDAMTDEQIDLETLLALTMADPDKLREALDLAVLAFDEAMRRPWINP